MFRNWAMFDDCTLVSEPNIEVFGGSDAARLINWLTLGVPLIWVSIAGKALVFSCRTLHEGSSKWDYDTVDTF